MGDHPNPTDKKDRRAREASAPSYGCWKCQMFGMTLYKVGRGADGRKLYACAQHRYIYPA